MTRLGLAWESFNKAIENMRDRGQEQIAHEGGARAQEAADRFNAAMGA
jgi:hypothetical protein